MMFKVFEDQQNVSLSQVPGQYTAVRLPYQDSAGLAAVFVLPNETYSSIGEAAGNITGAMVLDPETWSPLSQELWLSLPKFKVETQLPLKQVGSSSRFQIPNQIQNTNFKMCSTLLMGRFSDRPHFLQACLWSI
jgi:hypothetical protein